MALPAIPQVCDTVDAPVTLTMTSRVQEHPSNQNSPDVTLAASEKPAVQEEKMQEEKDEAEMTVVEESVVASQPEVKTAVLQTQAPLAAVNSENVTPPLKEESDASIGTGAIAEPLVGIQGTAAPATLTRAASLQGSPEAEATPTYKAEPPLSNGLPQDLEELSEDVPQSECGDTKSPAEVDGPQPHEPTSLAGVTTLGHDEEEEEEEKTENLHSASCPTEETTMHGEGKWGGMNLGLCVQTELHVQTTNVPTFLMFCFSFTLTALPPSCSCCVCAKEEEEHEGAEQERGHWRSPGCLQRGACLPVVQLNFQCLSCQCKKIGTTQH